MNRNNRACAIKNLKDMYDRSLDKDETYLYAIVALKKLDSIERMIEDLKEEQEFYGNSKDIYDDYLGYYNAYEKVLCMLEELIS